MVAAVSGGPNFHLAEGGLPWANSPGLRTSKHTPGAWGKFLIGSECVIADPCALCKDCIFATQVLFPWNKIINSLHVNIRDNRLSTFKSNVGMDYITAFLQLFVALGLLNVWVFRSNQQTPYRGSNSSSLKNEFAAYGLPLWSFYAIGFIKIVSALLLLVGLWKPFVVFPAALVISFMMAGAIAMHIKVRDPLKKALPALIMLLFSISICFGSFYHG
jgi:uncharacterized membrane protein YphA (DoxX/SURF4 family)